MLCMNHFIGFDVTTTMCFNFLCRQFVSQRRYSLQAANVDVDSVDSTHCNGKYSLNRNRNESYLVCSLGTRVCVNFVSLFGFSHEPQLFVWKIHHCNANAVMNVSSFFHRNHKPMRKVLYFVRVSLSTILCLCAAQCTLPPQIAGDARFYATAVAYVCSNIRIFYSSKSVASLLAPVVCEHWTHSRWTNKYYFTCTRTRSGQREPVPLFISNFKCITHRSIAVVMCNAALFFCLMLCFISFLFRRTILLRSLRNVLRPIVWRTNILM